MKKVIKINFLFFLFLLLLLLFLFLFLLETNEQINNENLNKHSLHLLIICFITYYIIFSLFLFTESFLHHLPSPFSVHLPDTLIFWRSSDSCTNSSLFSNSCLFPFSRIASRVIQEEESPQDLLLPPSLRYSFSSCY